MDCPNCHTYNPDERTVCWRCDKPLPKPKVEKKKKQISSQQWLYILIAVMVILMLVNMCGLPGLLTGGSAPSGMIASWAGVV